jgi:radical SAM modification target selenobiotic family peptide
MHNIYNADTILKLSVDYRPRRNGPITFTKSREASMDVGELKKILAGVCVAGLIAGSTFAVNGCASGKSA